MLSAPLGENKRAVETIVRGGDERPRADSLHGGMNGLGAGRCKLLEHFHRDQHDTVAGAMKAPGIEARVLADHEPLGHLATVVDDYLAEPAAPADLARRQDHGLLDLAA